MDKLGLLLSNKVLVVLSGLMFTGIAFASSGANALLQNNGIVMPETKIPEVQKVASVENAPLPVSSPQPSGQNNQSSKTETKSTSTATPKASLTPSPVPSRTPAALATPTPSKTPLALVPAVTIPVLTSRATPRPTSLEKLSSGNTSIIISGLGENRDTGENEESSVRRERADTSDESEISRAFVRARSDD